MENVLSIKLYRILKHIRDKKNSDFRNYDLIVYNRQGTVDMQIVGRKILEYFGYTYDDNWGFVVFIFFNANKPNNEEVLKKFKQCKYFEMFTEIYKDGNINYFLDCNNQLFRTQKIVSYISSEVFDNSVNTARIDVF
jgi:hypothetical protein